MRWIFLQLQVTNSPFNQEQVELLNKLLPTLTESQKIWLGGYLAASGSAPAAVSAPVAESVQSVSVAQPVSKDVTILYGSQTGNAQNLAGQTGKTLEAKGFNVKVASMSEFKPNTLKKLENLLIVVSTHGEGSHLITRSHSMSFYTENALQSLKIYAFQFFLLETVLMSFSVKQEKSLTNA